MKTKLFNPLLWAMAALMLIPGCSEDNGVSGEFSLRVENKEVVVPMDGGQATIQYTLKGSAGSKTVTVNCPEAWIHSFNTETAGVVEFTVNANDTNKDRDAVITLSCADVEPVKVTVTQAALEDDPISFTIEIKNTTQSRIRFQVTPSDKSVKYIALAAKKESMDTFKDDEARFQADLKNFEQTAAKQGMTLQDLLTAVTCSGEMMFPLSNLTPGTAYCLYVYGLTVEGTRTTGITKLELETLPKTECTFGINVQLDIYNADVTVTPSGSEVLYYVGHLAETRYQEYGGSISEAARKDISAFIGLCEALGMSREECVNQMRKSGTFTMKYSSLTPGMKHYFYACALDEMGAIVSDVTVVDATTVPAGDASKMTFEFAATDVHVQGATLSAIPSDKTCLYFWNIAKKDQTAESIKQGITDKAQQAITGGYFKDLAAYAQSNGVRGNAQQTLTLESGTEYRLYAIAANEDGTFATDVFFGESFTTPAIEGGSDVTIDINCEKYFSGAELAKLNKMIYGKFEDDAVGYTTITTTGDVDTYYYTAFYGAEWLDLELHPDEEFISSIIMWGRKKGKSSLHSWRWDADLVYVAVAVDKNGKYSAVSRKLIQCTQSGAAPIAEFDPNTMK